MTTPHYLLANPFAGQNIGHLRLAVVGDSGVGKTSFAREFIVTLPEVLSHDWEPVNPPKQEKYATKASHKDQDTDQGTEHNDDDDKENEEKAEQEDEEDDDGYDYRRTETLTEKFSSTMMEIPWDNMEADDEVPARNLVFLGEL